MTNSVSLFHVEVSWGGDYSPTEVAEQAATLRRETVSTAEIPVTCKHNQCSEARSSPSMPHPVLTVSIWLLMPFRTYIFARLHSNLECPQYFSQSHLCRRGKTKRGREMVSSSKRYPGFIALSQFLLVGIQHSSVATFSLSTGDTPFLDSWLVPPQSK